MDDQASRLRQLADYLKSEIRFGLEPRVNGHSRIIAVTSGKGGVGKTNIAVNLGLALVKRGFDVLVIDADLGLANVDVLLGTTPRYHLGHVASGERRIEEIVYRGPVGIGLVAAGSGLEELADMQGYALMQFLSQIAGLAQSYDFVLLDTGAGLGRQVMSFVLAADENIVVTTPEPTALADAYSLIKLVSRRNGKATIKVIVNQAASAADAEKAVNRLATAAMRFLGIEIHMLGSVPEDPVVGNAVRAQKPFVLAHPTSSAARAISDIAKTVGGVSGRNRTPWLQRLTEFFAVST